jgi:hypothetical protein
MRSRANNLRLFERCGVSPMSELLGFVAETDESGRIAWVWRYDPARKVARAIQRPLDHLQELDRAWCFGASRSAIVAWMKDSGPQLSAPKV